MGRWGSGNFECDGDFDVLGHWLRRIVDEINKTFDQPNEPRSSLYDNDGESWIVANVDILSVLSEQYSTNPPIDGGIVEEWKTKYLEIFDIRMSQGDIKRSYGIERRPIIEATFDRLAQAIEKNDSV